MKKLILIVLCFIGTNLYAQDVLSTFKYSWITNGLVGIKEYRVYASVPGSTNKFDLIATTTNNFVVVSNMITTRTIFFSTSIGTNGHESLPSRKVQYPRDLPESPKCFDYNKEMNIGFGGIGNSSRETIEPFISPIMPVIRR